MSEATLLRLKILFAMLGISLAIVCPKDMDGSATPPPPRAGPLRQDLPRATR